MRLKWMLMAASAAVVLAGCDKPKPGEPEEQPDPPIEGSANLTALADEPDLEEEAMTEAERRAAFETRAAENLAASKAFLDENAQKEDVQVTDSGLQYEVLEEGPEDGYSPASTDLVVVHYVGTLKDGVEFDSSRARGAAATFRLNEVIPGWTEGVQLMSEGDRFRFFVPPELGYGTRVRPGSPIGPNDALIFDVELIKVQNPERNLVLANQFLEENSKKDGVVTTESGLQYEVLTEGDGDGETPEGTNTVSVHYQGALSNGTEFSSSYVTGQPVDIPISEVERSLPGWAEGIKLMSEGDKYRFFIPPALAYGESGTPGGPIGPNEALVFEVELIEVK